MSAPEVPLELTTFSYFRY